jgi:rhomboid protease GluP
MTPAPVGQQCPVCVGRISDDAASRAAYRARTKVAQRTQHWPLARILRGASVTRTIIAINVSVVVAMFLTGGFTGTNLLRWGAMVSPLPRTEWWRMVTAMFVHIGLLHLLFNTWALMLFGPGLEERYGRARYLATYLVAGVLGSGFSLAFTQAPPGRLSAGASGAVFGILGAWLAFFVRHRNVPSLRGQFRSVLFLIGINLFFGATGGNIDNWAHIGGLVAGFVIGSALEWTARGSRMARRASLLGALGGALVLAFALASPHMT